MLLQDDGIYPGARVIEVLNLFVELQQTTGGSTPEELLDLVGLSHRARTTVRKLSGGEHRRLGLAMALVGQPELLLLDEPTAGVDTEGRERIAAALRQRCSDGVAVLMTTHELGLAERLADRVIVLDAGHVIADGTVANLVGARSPIVRFVALGTFDVNELADLLGLGGFPARGRHVCRCRRTQHTAHRAAEHVGKRARGRTGQHRRRGSVAGSSGSGTPLGPRSSMSNTFLSNTIMSNTFNERHHQ